MYVITGPASMGGEDSGPVSKLVIQWVEHMYIWEQRPAIDLGWIDVISNLIYFIYIFYQILYHKNTTKMSTIHRNNPPAPHLDNDDDHLYIQGRTDPLPLSNYRCTAYDLERPLIIIWWPTLEKKADSYAIEWEWWVWGCLPLLL